MADALACDYLAEPPNYDRFLNDYLLPNRPVLLGPALVSSWPAFERWATRRGTQDVSKEGIASAKSAEDIWRTIDWDYLAEHYGHFEVTVADCSTREFSDQKRESILFRDAVNAWESKQGTSLYVKDWHLARALHAQRPCSDDSQAGPPSEAFYITPDIFRDDWMNAYYSACTDDDFRFVYVGAAGTFTPLHRDVYTSYSWSTNVCGRKRWWLFPPEQTRLLFKKGGEEHMEVAYDVRDVDHSLYPSFSQARPIVVEQNDGETIFVPSGWYHQVVNLTDCISINHNWCNSVNLPSLYASMCAKVAEVEHALDDVRDLLRQNSDSTSDWEAEWVRIVQDVVEKDAGWNWLTFWKMIRHALRLSCEPDQLALSDNTVPIVHSPSLWQIAPPELTPSLEFIKERVRRCYDDFVRRDRREVTLVQGLAEVLAESQQLMR